MHNWCTIWLGSCIDGNDEESQQSEFSPVFLILSVKQRNHVWLELIQSPQRSLPSKIARNSRKTRPNFQRRNTKMETSFLPNNALWSSLAFTSEGADRLYGKWGLLDSAGNGTCNVWEVHLALLHVPAQLGHGSIQHGRVCLQRSYIQTTSDSAN